jgi:predicted ATPase/class 3 adenylate cyclase
VTFLFTDVEGSTRLWEAAPEAMASALVRHDAIIRRAIEAHGGYVFATGGDGFGVAFARAGDAAAAAVEAQAGLGVESWAEGVSVRVRMGLHTGEAEERGGDYFGPEVNRTARLMSAASGGQIVCSEVTAALTGGQVPLVDLGEFILRDLSTSQHVYQIGHGAFPALNSLRHQAGNLPVATDEFVGRSAELGELVILLGEARLVTLVGVGGVGKTRLALRVAAEAVASFRGGAWLVELGSVASAELVAPAVAAALGIVERGGADPFEVVAEALEARQLLLVLDNCEHVIDAAARLTELVLRQAPGVRILATSREALGLRGEHQWPVGGLDEASELFAVRARAVRPSFTMDAKTLEAVEEICRRLDRIPLAVELAAARVRSLAPADLAARLDERFRLLLGPRGAVDRHQTLRAAIDWSYDLLGEAERTAFAALSVFSGGCTLAAAEAVLDAVGCGDVAAIELLDSLVAKSLLVLDDSPTGGRYRLLETLRQYAREQLVRSGDVSRTEDAHAACYRQLARSVRDGVRGPDDLAWQERYDAELDNFRAAMGHLVASGRRPEALGVVLDVSLCAWMRGTPEETDRWLRELISCGDATQQAQALGVRAMLALQRSNWAACAECSQQSLDLSQQAGLAPDLWALVMRGYCLVFSGEVGPGLDLLHQATEQATESGDPWDIGYGRDSEAQGLAFAGRPEQAVPLAELSTATARHHGNLGRIALSLYASATIHDTDDDAAVRRWIDAADACARIRLTTTEIACITQAGHRALHIGDFTTSLQCFHRALVGALQTGQHPAAVLALSGAAPAVRSVSSAVDAAVVVAIHDDLAEQTGSQPPFSIGPYAPYAKDFEVVRIETAGIDIAGTLPARPLPVAHVYRVAFELIDRFCGR